MGRTAGLRSAILAVCVMCCVACDGAEPSNRSADDVALATPSQSPSDAAVNEVSAERLVSSELVPTVSLRAGSEWTAIDEGTGALFLDDGNPPGLCFCRVAAVWNPRTGFADDPPRDLIGWLDTHPNLDMEPPRPRTIDGVKGIEVHGFVSSASNEFAGGGCLKPGCLLLFHTDELDIDVFPGHQLAFIVLEVGGKRLTIFWNAATKRFDKFSKQVEDVLTTVRFEE